jgi:hypothetical protein
MDGSTELAGELRRLTSTAWPPYRFDMADAPYEWSQTMPVMEIPTANGCDPMALERIIQVRLAFAPGERWGTCYQVVNASSPVIGLANVGYVLSRSAVSGLRPVETIAGYTIYENGRALPRFFFAGRLQFAGTLAEAAAILRAPDFDPARTAVVEASDVDLPAGSWSPGEVTVESYKPSTVVLRTRSAGGGFLVASEAWYPGWEATIDGRPVRLYIADAAFRGMAVPAGEHTVTMRLAPRILWCGGLISLVALAGVFAVAARSWKAALSVSNQNDSRALN